MNIRDTNKDVFQGDINLSKVKKVFKNNLAVLKEVYPWIYRKVKNIKIDKYIINKKTDEEVPNLFLKDLGTYYYSQNSILNDVKDQIESLQLKNVKIAAFLGMGLGHELAYYIEQKAKEYKTLVYVIIEKDIELFALALHLRDYSGILKNKNYKFYIGLEEDRLFSEMTKLFGPETGTITLIKTIKPVYHHSSLVMNKDYYFKALRALNQAASYSLGYYGNSPEDSLIGIENMLANIHEIVENPGINLLYNKFKGRPAVIVSSGPSLNKNKHLLHEVVKKAVIICPDASLKLLMEMNVKPNMLTALERVGNVAGMIEGYSKEELQDVFFVSCPVINHKAYEVYNGPNIIAYRQYDHFKWLGIDRGMLDIKASSGNMAFKIAEALGCDPIILIGQDLSFSRDGKTHASGSHHGEVDTRIRQDNKIQVMGNDGQPIETNETWLKMLNGYKVDVAKYKGVCINSTEGGAFIDGTVVMPFSESIEKYIKHSPEFEATVLIREAIKRFSLDNIDKDYKKVLKIVDSAIPDMEKVLSDCKKGFEVVNNNKDELARIVTDTKESNSMDLKIINKLTDEIIGIKMQVVKGKETFQLLFMHMAQSFAINFEIDNEALGDKHDFEYVAQAERLLRHLKWFATIHDLAQIIVKLLYKTKEDLEEITKGKSYENIK